MADDELVDESGKPLRDHSELPREVRTRKGWARKKAEEDAREEERKLQGTHGRSVGEHIKAAARGIWEGGKYREAVAGDRDPVNPLYDRRRVKPKDDDDEEKPRKRVLYDKD